MIKRRLGWSWHDAICNGSSLDCRLMSKFCFTGELSVQGNAAADLSIFAPGAFTPSLSFLGKPTATHEFSVPVPARAGSHMHSFGAMQD